MHTEMAVQNPHAQPGKKLTYGLDVTTNVEDQVILENCLINARKVKKWIKSLPANDKTLVICGSGPSIRDELDTIRILKQHGADVWALNNVCRWLNAEGIIPDAQVIMDAQEVTVKAIGNAWRHLFASQVHPSLFDLVPSAELWHSTHGEVLVDEQLGFPEHDDEYCLVGSAVSVGNTSLGLAFALGYRHVHCFGFDSSNRGTDSHAIHQEWNDGEPMTINEWMGKQYVSSLTMSLQADGFFDRVKVFEKEGMTFNIHGFGLVPDKWNAFIKAGEYKPGGKKNPVTICTLNAGNYLGRGVEYTNILYDGVRRNINDTNYRFVVFTDSPGEYLEGIEVRPLPEAGLKGWWNKLALYKDGVFADGDRVLYFDLDTVITGNLDAVCSYDGDFAVLRDYYRHGGLQSSVMAWEGGSTGYLWDEWVEAGKPECKFGDQEWLEKRLHSFHCWQSIYPGVFGSFKASESLVGASVVVFHGMPRPHQVLTGWVPNAWRIGGDSTGIASHTPVHSTPAFMRAWAVLDRLKDMTCPVGAEIGVFAGQMSSELLKRPYLFLYMIDAWMPNGESYIGDSGDWHQDLSEREQEDYKSLAIERTSFANNRREVIQMLSHEAADKFSDGSLDFVFIDADHGYEGCKRDLNAWWPKVKSGGLFSGHDYENTDFPEFGVTQAVNEFAKQRDLTVELGENFTWFIKRP